MIEDENIYYTNFGYGKLLNNKEDNKKEIKLFWGSKLYTTDNNIKKKIKISLKPFLNINRKIEIIEIDINSTIENLINEFLKINSYETDFIINIQIFHLKGKMEKILNLKNKIYELNIKENQKLFLFGDITFQFSDTLKSKSINVI